MATTSMRAVLTVLQVRLLTFEPLDGSAPLGRRLSGGLNLLTVPDTAPEPYGAILLDPSLTSGRHKGERIAGVIQVRWFHRPRSKAMELEDIADVAQQAMLEWDHLDADGGRIACRGVTRQTTAPVANVSDPERVQSIMRLDVRIWPAFLTQYSLAASAA